MTDEQKHNLESRLWAIANTLRGKMDPDEFKDYILGLIFYKYLSEKMAVYANNILKTDELTYTDIIPEMENYDAYINAIKNSSVETLGYFLAPNELFNYISEKGKTEFILDDLQRVLNNIENSTMGSASEDDFDKLFEDMDLTSTKLGRTEAAKNDTITSVLKHLNEIDFRLEDANADVLGDAYEYLIGQFASGAGKKSGEFYTPQEVSSILARIVTTGKTRLKSVYDPTCGSGSLLLRVAKEVEDVGDFFGQELRRTTYNLARMNMILHDVHYRNFDIKQEDTLLEPQHIDKRFEAIVANPPFSVKWNNADARLLNDERFTPYGKMAPSSKADFAFIQHMLHHLDDNGTMAVVLPHGVLFRGAAEGHIREFIIKEQNYLDAVIGLPSDIFYGTGIPTCILVFKKCREHEDVLFVDASTCFEKGKNKNYLRTQDINRIVDAYKNRQEEDKFSHLASLDEIAENDYNLNIPRYVDTFEKADDIDVSAVTANLKQIELDMKEVDEAIKAFCAELGLEAPV